MNDDHRQFSRESWGWNCYESFPGWWFFNSLEEVENAAGVQAKVPHNHPDAIVGAKAAAVAVFLARTGKSKEKIQNFMCNRYGFDLSQPIEKYRAEYEWTSNCKRP